uniref:Uncharacterized protein n=1 Tax=Anguilla anguilla TaxID=7936 RepID=A0A0E9PNU6_ANGAN
MTSLEKRNACFSKGHARSQTVVHSICKLVMIAAKHPMQTSLSDFYFILFFIFAVALSICTDGSSRAPALISC